MSAEPFDFDGDYGDGYEHLARTVIPGYLSSFRQALALLRGRLGPRARVLVVGAGTGIEIVTFKAAAPGWRLTGVDPSAQMLGIAEHRVRQAGIRDGVRFIHGTVEDLDGSGLGAAGRGQGGFDAATCFNVMHFLPDAPGAGGKQALLSGIAEHLAPGTPFVLFELHGDPDAPDFDELFTAWVRFCEIQGMGAESWPRSAPKSTPASTGLGVPHPRAALPGGVRGRASLLPLAPLRRLDRPPGTVGTFPAGTPPVAQLVGFPRERFRWSMAEGPG